MKYLIINADDFGLTNGVTHGIVEAMANGVVTCTTAMVCTSDAEDHLQQWQPQAKGDIGAHLQLTDGIPISEPSNIPSLVTPEGRFPRKSKQLGKLRKPEILQEWRAQINRLRQIGIEPTHLDTHHHVFLNPQVFPAYCQLAKECGLPVRSGIVRVANLLRTLGVVCTDFTLIDWHNTHPLTPEGLMAAIDNGFEQLQGRGTLEVMCHPAYIDPSLAEKSTYVEQRQRELELLCSEQLLHNLQKRQIKLIKPSEMPKLTNDR